LQTQRDSLMGKIYIPPNWLQMGHAAQKAKRNMQLANRIHANWVADNNLTKWYHPPLHIQRAMQHVIKYGDGED